MISEFRVGGNEMKFQIEYKGKEKDKRTFSEGGVIAFLNQVAEFNNRLFATRLHHGFKKGKLVHSYVIEVKAWANGKRIDEKTLLETYPQTLAFSERKLAEMILAKKAT